LKELFELLQRKSEFIFLLTVVPFLAVLELCYKSTE